MTTMLRKILTAACLLLLLPLWAGSTQVRRGCAPPMTAHPCHSPCDQTPAAPAPCCVLSVPDGPAAMVSPVAAQLKAVAIAVIPMLFLAPEVPPAPASAPPAASHLNADAGPPPSHNLPLRI